MALANAFLAVADATAIPLEPNSIDLTVTSPPYNLEMDYSHTSDAFMYDEYLDFSRRWLASVFSSTKSSGRLCVNIALDTNKGGKHPIYIDLVKAAQEVGWLYQTSIVWNEQNISRRTAWGSWMSPSAPFVTAPVEMIGVFYKDSWRRADKSKTTDIERDEFLEWSLGHWTFPGEKPKRVKHPAPFPEELPKRLIKLYSYVEDTVLDPFVGSGTVAVVASRLGRKSIGFDISPEYIQHAHNRLAAASH